ncbi:hypothetical protein [Streptomyces niveus]|uniref:hypothetical protein n=1 Tax=Streptomyces niveus TaxID=193462 RepID=UPI0036C32975
MGEATMGDQGTRGGHPASGIEELRALCAAGGFWRLAPEWVPREGYSAPTHDVLKSVEAGLLEAVRSVRGGTADTALCGPVLEPVPVPVDGCRICAAAANGRASVSAFGGAGSVRNFNDIIARHPHRSLPQRKGTGITVGSPEVESAAMSRIRPLLHEENRRARGGLPR